MSKLLKIGRTFSRDCMLCYGASLVLIAIGGLLGNLPGIMKYGDWSPFELQELYFTVSKFGGSGTVFLVAAYALFKSKRWGLPFTAGVCALALTALLVAWLRESYDPEGFALILLFWATPLVVTFLWSLGQMKHEFAKSPRNQLA